MALPQARVSKLSQHGDVSDADTQHSDAPFDVAAFLAEPLRPAQVAAVGPSGLPLLSSLWFLYDDSRFWFSSRMRSPLLQAISRGSEIAVVVDEFSPPERIRQVRVRGSGLVEHHDPRRIERIYRRYLGDDLDTWPPFFRIRSTDAEFSLWSVTPTSGLVVAFPNFDAREIRWTRSDRSPLP